MLVWLSKIGLAQHFAQSAAADASEKQSKSLLTPAREECNKCDVTIDPYCRLVKVVCYQNLVVFHLFAVLNLTLMGGVGEK